MQFSHYDFDFQVPDEWWAKCGMVGFVPPGASYVPELVGFNDRQMRFVPVSDVAPVRRNLSHGVFNDDIESGISAEERVSRILRGFVSGARLPPVEGIEAPKNQNFRYELKHGAHRFYLSVAAGFTSVPMIVIPIGNCP